jgi:hypothetical protein
MGWTLRVNLTTQCLIFADFRRTSASSMLRIC